MKFRALSRIGQLLLVSGFSVVIVTSVVHQKVSATIPYINTMIDTNASGVEPTDNGTPGNTNVSISSDGRYVLFASSSSQLVSGDTNASMDWFVKDTQTGIVTRVDVTNAGAQLNATQAQTQAAMSSNGRFVVFIAWTRNGELPGNDSVDNVYVRDLQKNTTKLVSQSTAGVAGNANSWDNSPPAISADGRYIVFSSNASNLVANDTNGNTDVFLRDTWLNTTTILSNTDTGAASNNYSSLPAISCDGAYVAFYSDATNLVTGDPNTHYSIYLIDRTNGNKLTDITPNANDSADNFSPQFSCDGSTLLFASRASNLVANDTNNFDDIFAYHLQDGSIERVNVSTSGQQTLSYGPAPSFGVSFNGRYVTFATNDPNLVSGDTNAQRDIFIRDLQSGTTQRIDVHSDGTQTSSDSDYPMITEDGRQVVYISNDSGLVSGDTNNREDVFASETGY